MLTDSPDKRTKLTIRQFENIPPIDIVCIHDFAELIPKIEWSIKRRDHVFVTNTCSLDTFLFGLTVVTMHSGGMSTPLSELTLGSSSSLSEALFVLAT